MTQITESSAAIAALQATITELQTKLTSIETSVTKINNCFDDINSADCPSSRRAKEYQNEIDGDFYQTEMGQTRKTSIWKKSSSRKVSLSIKHSYNPSI